MRGGRHRQRKQKQKWTTRKHDINVEVVDPSEYPLTPNKKTQKIIRAGRREFADELGYAKSGN